MRTISIAGFAAILALGLVAPAAFSADGDTIVRSAPGGAEYVVPAGSPIREATFENEGDTARFAGEFVLPGRYRYGYLGESLHFLFDPDPEIAARLPRWKNDRKPLQIWFENVDKAIAAIVPRASLAALKAHRIEEMSGRVVIEADRYTITMECDAASYTVRFLRIHKPTVVAQEPELEEGC